MAGRRGSPEWTAQLQTETAHWVAEGLINEEQRKAIMQLYPEPAAGGRERTILIFTILGSLLVGAGVVLFFASNWQLIPAWVKVAAILMAVVGVYAGGYHLAYGRGDYPRLGHSLIFLGGLLYGAGIWLIAQIFHLESNFANGFLLWALGVLPVVWVTRSLPALYLGTATLTIWTVMLQTEGGAPHNYLFPLLAVGAVVPLARRAQSALAEAGVLVGLFLWLMIGIIMSVPMPMQGGMESALVGQLLIAYGAALLPAALTGVGDLRAYGGVGGTAALAGCYLLTFRWWYGNDTTPVPALWSGSAFQLAIVGLLFAALAAGVWAYWRKAEAGRLSTLAAMLVPVPAALMTPFLDTITRMVTYNLLLFGGTVALIVLGIRQRSQLLVNLGLAAFVIHVLTRYFDLFFSAMDKSLFFLLGGLLLLGGGWLLERNRRRWMGQWGGDGNDR